METKEIAKWVASLGPRKAARRVGVSELTIARWVSGITSPRGNRLALLDRIIKSWKRRTR